MRLQSWSLFVAQGGGLRLGFVAVAFLLVGPDGRADATVAATATTSPNLDPAGLALTKELPLRITPTRIFGGIVPSTWHDDAFDDRAWLSAPGLVLPRAALSPGAGPPAGVTVVDVTAGGPLYLRTRFDVQSLAAVRSLELRVAYQDGFVAYLNGRELARRGVPTEPAGAHPPVAHGAETEHIYLPVPPAAGASLLRARNNLLAIEVRPAAGRAPLDANAPSVAMGLSAFSGVRIVRGPYLIAPANGTVSVAWETDLPARGRVLFQPEGGGGGGGDGAHQQREAVASKIALRQVVRLSGLLPGTRYGYQVDVAGLTTGDRAQPVAASFQTAPRRDQPLRFVVYGDMRAPGHAAHAQVVAGLLREKPALIVNTGDLVAVGSEESAWQRYFEITAPMGAITPVAPALGNHEAYVGGAAKSWALFGLRTASPDPGSSFMSFDWGGAHFIVLDTNHPDTVQRDWLVRDLEGARRSHARAIFALCHDGPWSFGTHGGSHVMERLFAPVLAAGGTDVLFSGHDHIYARGTGVTPRGPLPFVVTGGGGAPLYNPTCQTITTPAGAVPTGEIPSPLPACPPSVAIVRKMYHYVVVEVDDRIIRLCPRLPDGTALEPCVEMPLRPLAAAKPR